MILTTNSEIPDRVISQIKEVSEYAGACDDWVTIKKEIMNGCPSHLRKLFSRRHPITKEQVTSEFDRYVIELYEEFSGISLKIRTLDERRKLKN